MRLKKKTTNHCNTVIKMKNALDSLASTLDMVEERISELDYITIEFSKPKKQKEQRLKPKKNKISKDGRTTSKSIMYI